MARRPRATRDTAPTTDDAIELALEAEASSRPATGAVHTLIAKQTQLVGWQIATERAAFALKSLTVVVGVVVAVIVAVLLTAASQYRGVTVQPFSVPPEMEARGLNGAAVATRVLDKLTAMQAGTNSIRAANTYANSWGDSVEVEIPQTGVSAGELWKFLRSWLGEEVKITGEVVRTAEGLQLTARAGGSTAPPITGTDAELEDMLSRAAEAIYSDTQPYRYAIYLGRQGRVDEALAALGKLASIGDETDRKWALAGWSLWLQRTGDFEGSILRAEQALEIDPNFGLARANLGGVLNTIGQAERAHVESSRAARLVRDGSDVDPAQRESFAAEMVGTAASVGHDHAEAARQYAIAARMDGQTQRGATLSEANQLAALGEVSAGRRKAAAMAAADMADAGGGTSGVSASPLDLYDTAGLWFLEDWPALVAVQRRAWPEPTVTSAADAISLKVWQTFSAPLMATTLARTGDIAAARAMLARATPDGYWTLITQGQVATMAGQVDASERWFTRAAAAAPSLADAHLAWGRARLERGDAAGAARLFAIASTRAPRWADPLKFWGDALMAQGDARGAMRKYEAASRFAPKWGALHLAWGRAQSAAGRPDAARERWRIASRLDLGPKDRAEVARRMGARPPA